MFLRQGYENSYRNLKTLSEENPSAMVCIICYNLPEECLCKEKILWPIIHALIKFRLDYLE
jgi:hypothetical protein